MTSSAQIIIVFLLTLELLGCQQRYAANQQQKDFVSAQQHMAATLEEYLTKADWKKRVEIQNAAGVHETLASRVFQAFEVLRTPGVPRDDKTILDVAWQELRRNPDFTLHVLRPRLYESPLTQEEERTQPDDFPVVWPEFDVPTYLYICLKFAVSGDGDYAADVLRELSDDPNKEIAQQARLHLDDYERKNWKSVTKNYRAYHHLDDLQWIVDNVLRKEMREVDVERLLGKRKGITNSVYYQGADKESVAWLQLVYFDSSLVDWNWSAAAPFEK